MPAMAPASAVCEAAMPEPQYAATGTPSTAPAAANSARISAAGRNFPATRWVVVGRFTAPGMCPATGSSGSTSPR